LSRPTHPGVYAIVHLATGRRYIGSASNIDARWRGHRSHLRRGDHHSAHLQHCWQKYGEAAFAFVVLETCPKDQAVLLEREQHWLDLFPAMLLNAARHAKPHLHVPCSPEQKRLISEALKGNRHGADVHVGKLTDYTAACVLHRFAAGEPAETLAREFGVSRPTITRLAQRRIWPHLTIPPAVESACAARLATGRSNGGCGRYVPPDDLPPAPGPESETPSVEVTLPGALRRWANRPKPQKVEVVCGTCKKTVLKAPCHVRRAAVSYCSTACRNADARARGRRLAARPEFAATRAKASAAQIAYLQRGGVHQRLLASKTAATRTASNLFPFMSETKSSPGTS
jgi:group I intron endonuclease